MGEHANQCCLTELAGLQCVSRAVWSGGEGAGTHVRFEWVSKPMGPFK